MAALKRRQDVFSTMMVKTYDLEYRNSVFTDQVTQRTKELIANGVVEDYLNELEVYAEGTSLKVKTGAAYINGERAYNGALATLAIADGTERLIRAKYATAADVDAHATRLDDIGGPHTVWFTDSINLYTVDDESQADPDAINLAWAGRVGGVVTVTDYREFAHVKLPLGAAAVVAAMLADNAVTAAKILNYNVTTGKIAQGGVTEAKLAEGTDLVPLCLASVEKPIAGESVSLPAPFTTYACATGGAYEYKILRRIFRDSVAGPIRRLRLLATADSAGTGTGTIYLVAWDGEPASYDPDDPDFDGAVVSVDVTAPGGGAEIDIEMEDMPARAGGTPLNYFTLGLVMRNSLDEVLNLTSVVLVGLR